MIWIDGEEMPEVMTAYDPEDRTRRWVAKIDRPAIERGEVQYRVSYQEKYRERGWVTICTDPVCWRHDTLIAEFVNENEMEVIEQ